MIELLGEITRSEESAEVAFERSYATDPGDLWQAVTAPERLVRWFAPVDGDLREGGSFSIHFDDGDVPQCRVVSCDEPHGFAWEWHRDDGASLVEVSIEASAGGSTLRLRHSRLPLERAPEYGAGWQAYVQSLGAYVEGGEDRDWWADFAAARDGYAAAM